MKTISQKCQPSYCSLAALLPVGIFHADTSGDYVAVNHRWREIAGITAAEAQRDSWIQALHPDDKERVVTEWYRTVKANLPFQAEYRFQNRDGKITWVLTQAVTQKNKTGTVTGYIGTITDITDAYGELRLRKWTEETLSQYCHQLENLVQERTANLQQVNEQLQQELAERQRLEKALRKAEEKLALRDRELLTLHRISEIHLSTQSLKATFDEIIEEISTATGFPIIAIELYDEPRQMMVFAAMKGVPLPPNSSVLEVPADQTLSGTVARTGEPAIKIYAPSESKNCDSNETLKHLGIKTFICMPMFVKGRAIGTLSLAHPEVMQVDDRLSQWIASLANYIASLTEYKRAETELRQVNDRFQLAAAAVNCLIYDWDVEKNQVERTEGIINLLGYRPEEAEPTIEWWFDHIHPDDRQRLQVLIAAALAQEDTYAVEYRVRNKDNQYLYVWDHALIVRDTNGRAVRVVGSRMDITDRKQAEEAVKKQKELLQTIFDHIPVMVGFFSATDQIQMVNREWERILGWSIQEMQNGNVFTELYPDPEYRQCVLDYIQAATGKWGDFKTRIRDGRILDTCWADVRLSDGSTIGIGQDITERKQMEEVLRQQFLRVQLEATIAQRIHQSLNLEEILNTTVVEARKFLACDRVLIYRFQSDGSGVVVVESVGADWRAISGTIIYDCCFAQTYTSLYQQGRIRAVEDIYAAGLTSCYVDLLAQFQVKANLVAPIVQDEKLWGLLVAHQCSETRQWLPLEIDLLKSLATQAAIAIQKSELYQQAQTEIAQRQQAEAALRQQFLREQLVGAIAQRIRRSLNLEEILNTTVTEVRQFLECDRVIIFRFQPDWSGIVEVESVDKDCSAILGTNIHDPCFEVSHVQPYKEGRVKAIPDIYTAKLSQCHIDLLARFQVRANLVVPILEGEDLWGLLIAHHCSEPRQWQQFEMDLLKQLATQVAIAIQQSELYKQSRSATAQALTKTEQLEQALSELQKTQTQLVQSEKMSSLGQLVAGVAHEINNPVTFIYANLAHAETYTQDILGLLKLYQQRYPNPTPDIESEIEAIDLDFLIEDLPRLLNSMKFGAERICEIVGALRNFSRLAEAEIKAVDIHEGLNSTLTILQNRLKAQGNHPEIQVIKEYGKLPHVECYAGQLNQVFMNLLSNAIDAVDEHNQRLTLEQIKANPSFIRIQTEVLDDRQVAIRISDNGPGMAEHIKARIFDPFFTTKPVGAGTGLGLSISYQIVVDKHGGQLHCFSQVGQGTEFVIEIPLLQRKFT